MTEVTVKGRVKVKSFTDLDSWKIGHELVMEIYKITKAFPKDELFGLTSQMRRSAVSVTSILLKGSAGKQCRIKSDFTLWRKVH
jgi:hypothetical protein